MRIYYAIDDVEDANETQHKRPLTNKQNKNEKKA